MKKTHILIIVIIAVAIGIIATSAVDTSSYMTFDEAQKLALSGSNKSVHVVGELKKDTLGSVEGIERGLDKVSFSFVMLDENKKEQKVQHNKPMPPDFIRSEKVVVVGHYKGNTFIAEQILLKCPSKYEEQNQLTTGS